jgi:hypothetical protein
MTNIIQAAAEAPQPKRRAVKPRTATKAKTASKAKPAAKAKPAFGYDGSSAQRMDLALLAGGTWAEIAEKAGVKPGLLRGHAKFRSSKGKHRLEETGEQVRLVPVEV